MNNFIKLIIILLFPISISAQISDNFNDGNFTVNPSWNGDDSLFTCNLINSNYELQLNASIPKTACLSTPNTMLDSIEWRFYIKFSFNPSSTSYARVYLASDNSNLNTSLNGYYLQFGEVNSGDVIRLFKQNGTTSTLVCSGTTSIANAFELNVKISRNKNGLWKIFTAPAFTENYKLESSAYDLSILSTSYFGILCKFSTSSYNKSFYFDNFYVGYIVVDTIPPVVSDIKVISLNKIDLFFSEIVDKYSSENILNYFANNGIANPISAKRDTIDSTIVHLNFNYPFTSGIVDSLSISKIKDLVGNIMKPTKILFSFYNPKTFDIVINEIMADPDPPVGLPDYEYLELFNKSNFPINLLNWKLKYGNYIKAFPDITIKPDSFLIVTSTSAKPYFTDFGKIVDFSSLSLLNTGTTITLLDSSNKIIHSITYTDDWYKDVNKKDGGWSLEQIDPNNPCGEASNWKASIDLSGGTPGRINSVNTKNPDNLNPQLIRASIIDKKNIQLFFSETLDNTSISNKLIYAINNNIGNPLSVKIISPDYKSVILTLSDSIKENILYKVTVSSVITDCSGNFINDNNSVSFAIPELPSINDIVINEILFNPKNDGVDFVELYNRTDNIFDLKNLNISSYDTVNKVLSSVYPIVQDCYLFLPHEYIVITTNLDKVKSQYNTLNPNNFIQISDMPSFPDNSGAVAISNKSLENIDLFIYSAKMQFPLLNDVQGVSLERVDFNRSTQDASNWHSASETVGFATPAYKNSQYNDSKNIDNSIKIYPEIFSPDNDGYNDILNISYKFNESDYVANISILDANGRLVKLLARNKRLDLSGTISWDGIDNTNQKCRIGIYIIYFEVFDLAGNIKHYKNTCVLAGKIK